MLFNGDFEDRMQLLFLAHLDGRSMSKECNCMFIREHYIWLDEQQRQQGLTSLLQSKTSQSSAIDNSTEHVSTCETTDDDTMRLKPSHLPFMNQVDWSIECRTLFIDCRMNFSRQNSFNFANLSTILWLVISTKRISFVRWQHQAQSYWKPVSKHVY
jgi:hypothetical protein